MGNCFIPDQTLVAMEIQQPHIPWNLIKRTKKIGLVFPNITQQFPFDAMSHFQS